jgi:hypothetical protein
VNGDPVGDREMSEVNEELNEDLGAYVETTNPATRWRREGRRDHEHSFEGRILSRQ